MVLCYFGVVRRTSGAELVDRVCMHYGMGRNNGYCIIFHRNKAAE